MKILQQIYIYLIVFPYGYVRILQPVVICTVIFVTVPVRNCSFALMSCLVSKD